jgi:hypothetical protein
VAARDMARLAEGWWPRMTRINADDSESWRGKIRRKILIE